MAHELPTLRMRLQGPRQAFTIERRTLPEVLYPVEESRGYERSGQLWSPGYFRVDLVPDQPAVLVASTEPWEVIESLDGQEVLQLERDRRARLVAAAPEEAREGVAAELVLAADQFLFKAETYSFGEPG
jgi:hypothetical protein